ncbi:14881_t:CDS:2 [Entrophospora sp. SA101]|nr:5059_t:CDS:2 [Entrophospora sp. SA101]CAJ0646419.1 10803_t:CDS:2 [Entrophospora sp. SA101]CAJ0753099.1 172_t:CDS:2 [Entrophospora sp. SA101]CAJ0760723.1 14881_t:CDS:2 [Entrophospora sp. SA101]CAJ0837192.1 10492_t:CDS:2 [Entrophospora sp. SA101]
MSEFDVDMDYEENTTNNILDSATQIQLRNLIKRETEIKEQINKLQDEISKLEKILAISGTNDTNNTLTDNGENDKGKALETDEIKEEICWEEFEAPEWCIPIKADVLTFEWDELAKDCQFDVILMDPPWQLATHAPTRGVAIGYQQLPDIYIEELPIPKLQKNGFLFIWVINAKYSKAFEMMRKWGYTYCDDITWVKQTVNRRMAKGHGFYLQHAKETCLVGRKGEDPPGCNHSISSDVIYSERRGQSQKPEELYEMIEELVPNGTFLEIFGRKNNLRDYWVTIGNEL